MRAILVIIAFFVNPDGSLRPADAAKTYSFQTMEQCNSIGNNLPQYYTPPEGAKVISLCLNIGNIT